MILFQFHAFCHIRLRERLSKSVYQAAAVRDKSFLETLFRQMLVRCPATIKSITLLPSPQVRKVYVFLSKIIGCITDNTSHSVLSLL